MSFFTDHFFNGGGYNATLSQSAQGQLSSSYTAALTNALMNSTVADWIGFLAKQSGLSTADALAVKQAVIDGNFTLSDLFGAAQSKTGAVDGTNVADPTPKITVNGHTFDLTSILTGLDTETWTQPNTVGTGKKATTEIVYHTREFYTDTKEPADYDANWSVENQDPDATPITANLTEDVPPAGPIDLLSTASDSDGGTPAVVAGSLTFSINGGPASATQPAFITIVDNIVTVDTSHPDLQPGGAYDIKLGETLTVVVGYAIEDGQGGSTDNVLTINIAGAADQYHASDSVTVTKDTSSMSGDTFAGVFDLEDGFNYANVTASFSAFGDFDRTNENVSVTGDVTFALGGSATSGPNPENLDDALGPVNASVNLAAIADGDVDYTITFSNNVADGSTATLGIQYDYWA
jgi:hypothetical protein